MRSTAVSLLLLLLAAPVSAQALGPGDFSRSMVVDGTTRTYLVHVPASYTGQPVPLVVDMHGFTSTADQQRAISGFLALSDARGFVATWPQGLNNAWNGGICCTTATDDVAFIRALVAQIERDAAIDARRVYATGLSNGGAMTQRLACEAADLFAAAAPVAFPISISPTSSCVPSRKIPVLTFMGLTDTIVPYNGGTFPSAAATFDFWRSTDLCGTGAPEIHDVSGASYCDLDTSCAPGVQVGLCSITSTSGAPYAGHILYINPDFDVARRAYDFMVQFSLPAPGPALPWPWAAALALGLGAAPFLFANAGERAGRPRFMRTHFENWSWESIVGLIVSTAVIVLPTAGCGAALWFQQARGIDELRAASFGVCNVQADAAARAKVAEPAGAPSSVGEASQWLTGLRSPLRESGPAREAFAVCMDDHSYASLAHTNTLND